MEAAIIITCLLLSAFFSGMEIAYLSANKVYLGVEKKQDSFLSKILTRLTHNPAQFMASMLIGNSVVLVIYGYYMGNVLMGWLMHYILHVHTVWLIILQTALSTFVILVTAEFLPKVFFQVYANTLIKALAVPAFLFYSAFFWVSKGLMAVSNFILVNIFKTKGDKEQGFFTRGELGNYVLEQLTSAAEQEEVDSEIQIFKNALEFSGVRAQDIMTPRSEIAAVDVSDSVTELRQLFVDTDYSKLVVYSGSPDAIVGYVHSFELFKKPAVVTDIMIPAEHVPGTMYIKELLDLLTRKRKSMAVVLGEDGLTAGIITMEDIVEELFGEIEDEHDNEETIVEEKLADGSYIFSARLDIEYLNEQYGLALPLSALYSSLGGFIVHCAGYIPAEGESLAIDGFTLIVVQASGKMIGLIKVIPQSFQ